MPLLVGERQIEGGSVTNDDEACMLIIRYLNRFSLVRCSGLSLASLYSMARIF